MFLLKVVKVPDTDNSQNTDGNSRFPSITGIEFHNIPRVNFYLLELKILVDILSLNILVGEGHLFRILQTDDRSLGKSLHQCTTVVFLLFIHKKGRAFYSKNK